MTKTQITKIMSGKNMNDVQFVLFAPANKLIPDRYKECECDLANEYFHCISDNGREEYWDFGQTIGIVFKEKGLSEDNIHYNRLTGDTTR